MSVYVHDDIIVSMFVLNKRLFQKLTKNINLKAEIYPIYYNFL